MSLRKFAIAFLCCSVFTPCIDAQETSPPAASSDVVAQKPAAPRPFAQRNPRYKIESSDVIDLQFTFTPELDQTVTVQPDGYISLREVGDVYIRGMNVPEAVAAIKHAYSGMLRDPVINLTLKEFVHPYIIVNGTVKSPGKYDLRADTTVAEAVAIAGGFTSESKHSEVWVYRRRDDNTVDAHKVDVKKLLAKGDLSEDLYLQSGDMIFVPQSTLSKIRNSALMPRINIVPGVHW